MVPRYDWLDERIKRRTGTEDCPIPEGFAARLEKQLTELPERRQTGRMLRSRILILAAAVCILAACTGTAAVVLRQNRTYYFNTEAEAAQAADQAAEAAGASTAGYGVMIGEISDYAEPEAMDMKALLAEYEAKENGELLEHAFGGGQDGWTEMFSAQDDALQYTFYQADSLAGLGFLWPAEQPDLSWLEARYAAVPGCESYYRQAVRDTGNTRYIFFSGAYRGDGDARFSLDWTYHPVGRSGDSYMVASGPDSVEEYETADGVTVTIETAASVTGTSVFRLEFSYSYADFSMYGTQMDLEEVKEIADHLNLSSLCDYRG